MTCTPGSSDLPQEVLRGGKRHLVAPPTASLYAAAATTLQRGRNHLLSALPADEYVRLRPKLERVVLVQGDVLYHHDQRIEYVYFPTTALITFLVTMENGATVEMGLTGAEGMVGLPSFWGVATMTHMAIVQHAGGAWRMRASLLRRIINPNDHLHNLLLCYTNLMLTHASQAAACNALHSVEQRVARWLLTTGDRLQTQELRLTHDFIARMLGVRRAGITVTLNKFSREKLLETQRASISINDRQALEARACECYQIIKGEFERCHASTFRSHQSPLKHLKRAV